MSSAPRLDEATDSSPIALVVHPDDDARTQVLRVLRNEGYAVVAVDALPAAQTALASMPVAVVVLDTSHDLFTIAKWLVQAAREPAAPPVLLLNREADARWIAERFGLLTARRPDHEWTFAQLVRQSQRERRTPRLPR